MNALGALLLGHALAAPEAREIVAIPRWEAVPRGPESTGTLEGRGEVRLARLPGPEPMRAECGPGQVPRRLGVLDGAFVEGAFSVPVRDESGWVFPPAPEGLDTWLVTPSGCAVYRLDDAIAAEAFAHAEHRRPEEAWRDQILGEATLGPEATRWIGADGGLDRYVAVRPPGPHPAGWAWWSGDGDHVFAITGPRRLRVEARWVGDPRPVCLTIDGAATCRSTGPEERLALRDGRLARVPEVDDGQAVGRVAAWTAVLPPGRHEVSVPGEAQVRVVGTWPVTFTGRGGLEVPEAVAVFPDASSELRDAAPPDGAPRSIVLLGPTTTPIAPDDVRWVPLDDPGLARATRVDETGVMTLHLLPFGDAPCVVRLPGGESWRARPREAVQRFLWTGLDDAPGWPVVEGCDARVRVTGLAEAQGAWVAGRWWAANPGGSLSWTAVPPEARLMLRHPSTQTRPYRVQITHPSGRVDHWTVDPRDVPADRWTAEGTAWQPAQEIALEPGPGEAHLWSEVPLLARLTALAPALPAPVPVPVPVPVPAEPAATIPASAADLPRLSRAVATAPDDASRAEALIARAAALEQMGQVRLAWIDLERAAVLDEALADENPLTDRLKRVTAAIVHGPDRWVPDDPLWVPVDAPAEVDARAAVGDWLGVAARLRATDADPRVWWREAVVAGQIATADERVLAYEDLVDHTPPAEIEHPWLWPLRVLTAWERIVQVRGTTAQPTRWPEVPSDEPDLFPDAWPADEIVALVDGYEVAVPRAGGRSLPVRCLSTRLDVPGEGCRFVARSPRGEVLAEVSVDGWGTPGTLSLPARAGTVQVAVRPSEGVRAEVRVPTDLPVRRDRTAWPVWAGGSVAFDVLGPTTLRLETWVPKGDGATIAVTMRGPGGTKTREVAVGPLGDVRLPVEASGPVEIRVAPSRTTWIAPSIRVPRGASRLARDDRAWIRAGAATGSLPPPPPPPTLGWKPPTGRPPPNPPLTAYVRAGVGTSDLDDLQPDPREPTSLSGVFAVGLASRPVADTWWFDAWARGDVGAQELVSGGALVEGLVVKRTWRLWVWGRGEVVRGLDPRAPLTTAVGALRVTADAWPWPRWQLVGRVHAEARGIVDGSWDPFVYVDETRLWSDHKAAHRRSVEALARARFYAQPWLDAAVEAWVLTNEDVFEPLEGYGAATWAEWTHPGLHLRGGFEIERRLVDEDRDFGFWSPSVYLRGGTTFWPDRDIALQPRASVRYRIAYDQVEVLLELRAYFSRDRALRDVSPSRLPAAFAHEWHQDAAAARKAAP